MSNALRIWEEQYKTLQKIPDRDMRARLALAMIEYAFSGEHEELAFPLDAIISPMYPSLTVKNQGGAPAGNKNQSTVNQRLIKKEESKIKDINNSLSTVNQQLIKGCSTVNQPLLKTETETETETESVCIKRARDDVSAPTHPLEEKKTKTNFYPPTVEDVSAYCLERKNGVNPAKFVDFYASKGWMVGKNKMKDWRAAVRNWERDDPPKNPAANDDEKCWF